MAYSIYHNMMFQYDTYISYSSQENCVHKFEFEADTFIP